MPHADSTLFPPETLISKASAYTHLLDTLTPLLADQRNWVANLANTASLLWHMFQALPSPSNGVNWAGFYVLDPSVPDNTQLILAPFMGKVACQTIRVGRGVCGTVAKSGESVVVRDVEDFPGHIACDGDTRSEVVVPLTVHGKVVGVLDIDCTEVGGFDDDDRTGLEAVADLLAQSCDW